MPIAMPRLRPLTVRFPRAGVPHFQPVLHGRCNSLGKQGHMPRSPEP
ncbi:hypothetical protein OJJOAM_004990 [Cupriavidus sp. H18C1]